MCKNSSAIFAIDILLMVMGSEQIVRHLGQHFRHLNTTRFIFYLWSDEKSLKNHNKKLSLEDIHVAFF